MSKLPKELEAIYQTEPLWWARFLKEIEFISNPISGDDLWYYISPPYKDKTIYNVHLEI